MSTYDFKDEYLAFHGYTPGTAEAEEAWARKVDMMERPIRAPMGFVSQDIHYTSPIDGRLVTSSHARREDLKRSGCIPYEEGMKQDAERKQAESQAALERNIDATVEREIETMPGRKREKLAAELASGADIGIDRRTA